MKGLVGVPHTGTFDIEAVKSFMQLRLVGHGTQFIFLGQCLTHIARENLAHQALVDNYDWILFIDSDMTVPHDIIEKWAPKIGQYGVIAAPCFKRFEPYTPCFYEKCVVDKGRIMVQPFKDWPKDKFFEAEACGAACMMISTAVFRSMSLPYFYPFPTAGEDVTFCIKAKTAGNHIWIDPSMKVGHLSTRPVYESDYRRGA